jgi:F0F1-type ATP synthase membrane subunit b/b'
MNIALYNATLIMALLTFGFVAIFLGEMVIGSIIKRLRERRRKTTR